MVKVQYELKHPNQNPHSLTLVGTSLFENEPESFQGHINAEDSDGDNLIYQIAHKSRLCLQPLG